MFSTSLYFQHIYNALQCFTWLYPLFINVLVIVQRVMSSSLASWYRCIPEVPIIPRQPVLRIFRELKKKEEENKILRPDAIWSFLNFLSFAILAFKQASFYFFKNEILNEIWKELKKVLTNNSEN